jgi:hypothetical protein
MLEGGRITFTVSEGGASAGQRQGNALTPSNQCPRIYFNSGEIKSRAFLDPGLECEISNLKL